MTPRSRRSDALALLGLLGATLCFTWPLSVRLGTQLAGPPGDNHVFYWNVWWFRHALWQAPQWPFHTPLLFHPDGASLAFHTTTLLGTVPGSLLGLWLPLPAAFNLVVLACFFGTGAAMYLLARRLLASSGCTDATAASLSLFAGVAYTFAPFHMAHIGHLNILNVGVVPLAAWAFLRVESSRQARDALLLGACLAGAALADGYHALTATMLVAVLAAWRAPAPVSVAFGLSPPRRARHLASIAAGAFAALSWPVWVPMLQHGERWFSDIQAGGANTYVADVVAWILPSPFHPLWKHALEPVYARLSGNLAESVVFPTFTVWALAFLAWRRCRGAVRRWLAVALVFAILALGPFLHVAGHDAIDIGPGRCLRLPLPKVLLDQVPLLAGARVASRFASAAQLGLVLAATWGLAHWARVAGGAGRPRRRRIALALACAGFECVASPIPMTRIDIPAAYTTLAASAPHRQPPGALLEVPPVHAGDKVYQLYQTVHGRPLLGGRLARVPTHAYDRLHRDPFLDRLQTREPWGMHAGCMSLSGLDSLGVDYVMLHRGLSANPALARLLAGKFEPVDTPGDAQLWRRRAGSSPAPR